MSAATPLPRREGGLQGGTNAAATGTELTPLRAASTLLRYVPLMVLLAIVAGAVSVVHSLLQPLMYTSSGSFVPNSGRSAPAMSGIAAQFGIAVPGGGGSQSPDFYTELIRTRTVVDSVIAAPCPLSGGPARTGTLAQALGNPSMTREKLRDAVAKAVSGTINEKTGTVRISATTKSPALSAALASRVLQTVDEFNRRNQRTQAAEERQFTEQRYAEAKVQLDSADARVRDFLQRNRLYQSSPELQLQYEHLQRDQQLATSLYLTLAQSLEQARIEEVRDRPQITMIESPAPPDSRNPRGTLMKGVFGALLGAALGFVVMLVREYIESSRVTNATDLEELSTVRHELVRGMRRPWRPIDDARHRDSHLPM